ncbi:phosphonoacetaldehyde hydrolase [Marivibrio halodurans]|uniref:Phosphonoacetaldehyde hydrolase n=1 Tax=Marivibrio halodurans TaxID=2039722 RepID=A0A8J7S366_9PROT|nr:phosphonoacetaldehyde hydrolase [Marivibrio halodurans]MBP5857864.1 phosphonoacetaldehyde hydrolase [Marivibrio halodurans]
MTYRYTRRHIGPVEAVLFDNAGTIVDFGSTAPVMAFVELFKRRQVQVSVEEARGPMGAAKRDHIAQMCAMPGVAARWEAAHGKAPTEADIDAMYEEFLPLQVECLQSHATVIPGAVECFARLREAGKKIGTTTGYPREVMRALTGKLADQGIVPDSLVCASDVAQGRPKPDMCLQSALNLGVADVGACVNVDDSAPGIEAGLAAGMWTIGLACSGNEVGLSFEEWSALSPEGQAPLRAKAGEKLARAGAHFVVDTVADVADVIAEIEARMRMG